MAEAFSFELVTPEALVLSGGANQVLVPGTEGYFTVLSNHAPFMSSLKPGIVEVIMADGASSRIFIRGGFADVSPTGLTLLAEQVIDLKEMDMNELETQIRNARENVADAQGDARIAAQAMVAKLEEARQAVAQVTKSH